MSWRDLWGKTRKGKPLDYVETRPDPMSYPKRHEGQYNRSAWVEAQRRGEEDLQATAAAICWGVAIGAGVALIVWICMQPVPG